ncbi:MAG: lipoyl(octanoyl) transferase LipB [Nitrospira sp.]
MSTRSSLRSSTDFNFSVPTTSASVELLDLATPVRYADAWMLQQRLHRERVTGLRPDTLVLLEHQPIYTVGPRTSPTAWGGDPDASHINGIEVQHVTRGGSITYHGPGQLVVYPIVRLSSHARGVRDYVARLEEAVIRALHQFGIEGRRRAKAPGVWVSHPHEAKMASLGIRVERGVTMHGLALNVDMDLRPFNAIVPCGLTGCRVTSIAEVLGRPVSVSTMRHILLEQLQTVFPFGYAGSREFDNAE